MLRRRRTGLMAEGMWLEGTLADCPGEPLTEAQISWKNALPSALREVCNRVTTAGGGIWLVGGSVREAMLENPWKDLDLATTMTPDEVEALFPRSIPTGAQYGTITVRIADTDIEFEVTTLRSEGSYGDGRRPREVTFGQSLSEDLSRRDFTINAMAIDLARNLLHDPYHGQSDLQNKRLSAVGDAAERLGEDGLRVLRAYRFMDQERRGFWEPDEHLASALKTCGEMLEKVSQERIWSEFNRILGGQRAPEVLERMRIDGVLSRILPGWDAELESQHELSTSVEDVVVCRLTLLSSDIPAARWRVIDHDMRILTIPNHTRKRVLKLHGIIGHLPHDLVSCRRYRICIDEDVNAHLDIESALNRKTADAARILIKKTPKPKGGIVPIVDGHQLSNVSDLPSGRRLGRLKEWLFRLQIDQDLSTDTEVLAWLGIIDWQTSNPEDWPEVSWP
tara:strand:- start:13246 stop:14595 length:1350 start_codon:yes stop_codon:yes gene_type:complete